MKYLIKRERERERKGGREREGGEREGGRLKTHHLPDSKRSDIFDPDGDIKHLRGNELPMTSPLKLGHLNQHSDIPG